MTQTNLGGAKSAATRIGISLEEYQHNLKSGLKWCSGCRNFKNRDFFSSSRGKGDGKHYLCKDCSRIKGRDRYRLKPKEQRLIPKEQQKPKGSPIKPPRDGDKRQARRSVNREVAKGNLPHVSKVPCADCGHLGSDRLHEYDHFRGYAGAYHLEVECVCISCHVKREKQRRKKRTGGIMEDKAMDETSEGLQRLALVEAKVEKLNSWIDNELRSVVDNAVEVIKSLGDRVDKIEQLLNKDVEKQEE